MNEDEGKFEVEKLEELRQVDLSGGFSPVITGDPPEWFTGADAKILFILMTGLTLTPSILADHSGLSRVTVSRRLSTLHAGDLVEKVDRGKYRITDEGAFVVTGDPSVFKSGDSN